MQENSYKRRLRRFPSSSDTLSNTSNWEAAGLNPYSSNKDKPDIHKNELFESHKSQQTTSALFEKLQKEYKHLKAVENNIFQNPFSATNSALTNIPKNDSFTQKISKELDLHHNSLKVRKSPSYNNLNTKRETNLHIKKKRAVSENYNIYENPNENAIDRLQNNRENVISNTAKTIYSNDLESKIRKQLEEELAEFDTENVGSFYSSGYSFNDNEDYKNSLSFKPNSYSTISNSNNDLAINDSIIKTKDIHLSSLSHQPATYIPKFNSELISNTSSNEYLNTDSNTNPKISLIQSSSNNNISGGDINTKNIIDNSSYYRDSVYNKENSDEKAQKSDSNYVNSIYLTPRTISDKSDFEINSNIKSDTILQDFSTIKSSILQPNSSKIPPKAPQIPTGGDRRNRRGRLGLAKPRRLNSTHSNMFDSDDTENDPIVKAQDSLKLAQEESKAEAKFDIINEKKNDLNISSNIISTKPEIYTNKESSYEVNSFHVHDDLNSKQSNELLSTITNVKSTILETDIPINDGTKSLLNSEEKKLNSPELKQLSFIEKSQPNINETPALGRQMEPNKIVNIERPITNIAGDNSSAKTDIAYKEQNFQQNEIKEPQSSTDSKKRNSSSAQILGFDSKRMLKVNNRVYTKVCLSGRGGSSKVYKVLGNKNDLYAIKRVSLLKTDPLVIQGYMDECKLLRKLDGNPFIIQLYDSEVQREKGLFYMVMELGEIDLAGLLRRHGELPLSMNFIRLYWEQMLNAVQTIHEAKIVHSDLKPANFLLVKGSIKLIDFGIAKSIGNDTTNIHRDQQIGTVNYMSPEALQDTNAGNGKKLMKLGCSSDVWSLGCILYQLCYGCTPFSKLSMFQKLVAIPNAQHNISYPKFRAGMLQLMSSETDPNSPDYITTSKNFENKTTNGSSINDKNTTDFNKGLNQSSEGSKKHGYSDICKTAE
ncbi:hypothetical protein BB561_001012 [Smittium simulii]|uniref:Protein kinase domain-containing protein n=1 Tax=Smittium simulii TaxID=133385 RepID=A0A2T9YWK0_9FUNG|nr:hypothetical protein BB561_001012 [Smittium simulii]